MGKVKILPEILSNKIAAGEVVERPASVVKELLENALDAGATRITIEVEKGGRTLIRVSDNGAGMAHDDALLALERYATSKIRTDPDLFAIRTLGFRGEALPSIASVSRFTLETADGESDAGTRIEVEGGKITAVTEVGAPVGTLISVKHLFFNTPARRKFLKTVNTEMGHIADTVASMALGWPEVHFRLSHDGREVRQWTAAGDPRLRAGEVLGRDAADHLIPLRTAENGVALDGWIVSPRITRTTSRGIFIHVNGRYVRDRVVHHALFKGYGGRLMKGRYPMAAVFVRIDPDQVDVNVHPTKSEVRFVRQGEVHDLVAGAVARALTEADRPRPRPRGGETGGRPRETRGGGPAHPPRRTPVAESVEPFPETPARLRPSSPSPAGSEPSPAPEPSSHPGPRPRPTPAQAPLWERGPFGDLTVIGQLRNTYILCESPEGLVVIDQHAAHERVLFERLKGRDGRVPSQGLLLPETVDVGFREADLLERLIPRFAEKGLEMEPFGGTTFVVKSVPASLEGREVKPLILDIVQKLAEASLETGEGIEEALDQCLKLMACHGAIRANQALADREIRTLLDQLEECDNPSHCPHGRPTWVRWDLRFLEKSFRRIV